MITINGLASLPSNEFDSLLANIAEYMMTQEISLDWMGTQEIRECLVKLPRVTSTTPFLKSKLLPSHVNSNRLKFHD
jgi:hypothetical protein